MAEIFETKAKIATFGGVLLKLSHNSPTTGTPMALNLFLPGSTSGSPPSPPVPALIYLSGLTCSPDNCSEKGFLHATAAAHKIAVVYPDTSPRGLSAEAIPDLKASWDFGEAAGFYIDATREPYAANFKMESYLTKELPELLWGEKGQFKDAIDGSRVSIAGHSMGGHGALTLYLKNPGKYRSVSAWAPITNPINCPWGQKAFTGYFGDNVEEWKKHDATELVAGWKGPLNCLIDVGKADGFYQKGQLLPENFEKAVQAAKLDGLTLRYQEDYDHSYFFISTFGADHIAHAAQFLYP